MKFGAKSSAFSFSTKASLFTSEYLTWRRFLGIPGGTLGLVLATECAPSIRDLSNNDSTLGDCKSSQSMVILTGAWSEGTDKFWSISRRDIAGMAAKDAINQSTSDTHRFPSLYVRSPVNSFP